MEDGHLIVKKFCAEPILATESRLRNQKEHEKGGHNAEGKNKEGLYTFVMYLFILSHVKQHTELSSDCDEPHFGPN